MQRSKLLFLAMLLTTSTALSAGPLDIQVDLEKFIRCEVQGDNTLLSLDRGIETRILEVKKTNKNETQLDKFEVDCYPTEQGLTCSDYLNIAQVELNAVEIQESCPFWKESCETYMQGELTYRQRNLIGLRKTQKYELRCPLQQK